MKLKIGLIVFCFFCMSVVQKKTTTKFPNGKFQVGLTMKEGEKILMAFEELQPSRAGYHLMSFDKGKFSDYRQPGCGNDIAWNKTGTYATENGKLILNYIGGALNDNIGGDSMQVYLKAKVIYNYKIESKSRIILKWISGKTEKTVKRTLPTE